MGQNVRLTVARIGKAQGLRGEVTVQVHTDDPQGRFSPGTVLLTDPPEVGPLTVARSRNAAGKWFVQFETVADRTAAEALRGTELLIEVAASDEEGAWYSHELTGLRVELLDGTVVGQVRALEDMPAHDVLIIEETGGARTAIPFVKQIVPVVDVAGGRVVLDPPGGLLASDAESIEVVAPDEEP